MPPGIEPRLKELGGDQGFVKRCGASLWPVGGRIRPRGRQDWCDTLCWLRCSNAPLRFNDTRLNGPIRIEPIIQTAKGRRFRRRATVAAKAHKQTFTRPGSEPRSEARSDRVGAVGSPYAMDGEGHGIAGIDRSSFHQDSGTAAVGKCRDAGWGLEPDGVHGEGSEGSCRGEYVVGNAHLKTRRSVGAGPKQERHDCFAGSGQGRMPS